MTTMIVFYLKETGACVLPINCARSEITEQGNKAYFNGESVCNDLSVIAYAEVPEQSIYTDSFDENGMIRTPKLFSELTQGTVAPSDRNRIAALEDALLALTGV
jgi:hypothetical protein